MAQQRIYHNIHPDMWDYRPISRYIRIRFNSETDAYFLFKGRREYVNNWENLSYPVMVEDADGKLIVICSFKVVCNWGSLLMEIHPDCEYVRIWEEIPKKTND